MLTVIVSGRNDNYGGDFRERLFRTTLHNSARLYAAGIDFEYLLAEWNPIPGIPALSEEFVARIPRGRALIVPREVHQEYSLNSEMPFHEMAAKNAALRRARGSLVIVTNADILFSDELVLRVAAGDFTVDTLYRAHRIDVKPELRWDEMQNPENQLRSGEGFLPPPWYLGAGGDFCLAARSLWHSLGGFNERIRFSTRAKDWQFFLSAAAQGIGIDFIGDVYHLDHEGGFRNTNAAERNVETVHFGRWWDIEFGLPVTNPAAWGFNDVRERQFGNHPRISILRTEDYAVAEEQNRIDHEMISWLTRPPDSPDTSAAFLIHAICAAHRQNRRLICRIEDPRLLVALSGLEAVASRFDVRICCNWNWPEISGYRIRPFDAEPAVFNDTDWIVEEVTGSNGGIRLYEYGTSRDVDVLPTAVPVNNPEFNPVLARRLLRACLLLQSDGPSLTRKIAIYGAGSHTTSLLQWGLPDSIELVEIVDSRSLTALTNRKVDAVVLSSSSFESDMLETCRLQGISNVIALYSDWPVDMWEIQHAGVNR
jgi:hypothetical protein